MFSAVFDPASQVPRGVVCDCMCVCVNLLPGLARSFLSIPLNGGLLARLFARSTRMARKRKKMIMTAKGKKKERLKKLRHRYCLAGVETGRTPRSSSVRPFVTSRWRSDLGSWFAFTAQRGAASRVSCWRFWGRFAAWRVQST